MARLYLYLKRLRSWAGLPIMIMTLFLIMINTIYSPNFLSRSVLEGFLSTYAPLVLCALGQSIVLIGGGIDLSITGVISLANVTTIVLVGAGWDFLNVGPAGGLYICRSTGACTEGWSLWTAAAGGICAGLCIGIINGFSVAFLRIRPLLATLTTMFIGSGAALYLLPLPGGQLPMEAVIWYQESSFLLPKGGWIIIGAIVFWIMISNAPFGTRLRSTGRDAIKAYASGVPVPRTQFLSYVFSSLFAAVGGIALTLTITAGDPAVGGPFTLNSIAAAVLGGVALSGGEGEAGGPVFGALFLGLIVNTVLSIGIPPWYQWLVSGIIILFGLAGTVVLKKSGLLGGQL